MADTRATSFGSEAANYEVGRPDYPFEAVAWMLEPLPDGARRVADVGAGTGKLTRALLAAPEGQVVAIDPDREMLATLSLMSPGVPTFVGTAERMPLPDRSVDAVVLGQAWHWVDPVAACLEIGRVLRPGGVLGLIWNIRDSRVDWVRRMTQVMESSAAEDMLQRGAPVIADPLGALESERWEWTRRITRDQLHRMARSRSAVIAASDSEKARITGDLDALFDDLGLVGDEGIDLPYVTHAFRSVRG